MAVWFFYGKEEYRIEQEISKLKNELLDDTFRSMNYRVYYSPSFDELLDVLQSAPLMFGNLLSVIHCENYFIKTKNRKTDFTDTQLEGIENALKTISDSNNVVFVCELPRNEDKKPDSRTKQYKVFTNSSKVVEFPQFRTFDKDFVPYVISMAKEKGIKADTKTAEYLTERLGVNLRIISNELEKLSTAIYPEKTLKIKDIDEYCRLTDNVLALADLIVSNDKTATLKQLFSVFEKTHPLEVSALLQTNLRKLIFIKANYPQMSFRAIADSWKMKSDYPVKLMAEKIKNISLKQLSDLKHNLTEAEYKIKTGQTVNPEYLIESVILGKDF